MRPLTAGDARILIRPLKDIVLPICGDFSCRPFRRWLVRFESCNRIEMREGVRDCSISRDWYRLGRDLVTAQVSWKIPSDGADQKKAIPESHSW
jgi:hypothetical protein